MSFVLCVAVTVDGVVVLVPLLLPAVDYAMTGAAQAAVIEIANRRFFACAWICFMFPPRCWVSSCAMERH